LLHIVSGEKPLSAIFIRAPSITNVGEKVRVLASIRDQRISSEESSAADPHTPASAVLVQQGNLLGCCFHPELSDDFRVHEYFVAMCRQSTITD
jgi:pyridoxal 5'-phosphate synthase pdxT subunit